MLRVRVRRERSRTCMLATVSCASTGYYNTVNTLKYADRAKEIKTSVHHNVKSVEAHILEYQQIIQDLQMEVAALKQELHGGGGGAKSSSPFKEGGGGKEGKGKAGDEHEDDWQVRCPSRPANSDAKKSRIVAFGSGTGAGGNGPERGRKPKRSWRTCSPRYGLQSCRGESAGVAKRPRERSPTRNISRCDSQLFHRCEAAPRTA
jgi:hypothetical protein